MSVRMSDVASKAGVSVSTVSKVLNGQGVAMQLNVETIDRVQRAAAELGYVPNALARDLRTQRPNRIGMLMSGFQDPGIPLEVRLSIEGGLMLGLTRAARDLGLPALTIYPIDPNEPPDPRAFLDGRVDGLIVQSDPWGVDLMSSLDPKRLPLIGICTRAVREHCGYVDIDHKGGARAAVEHLLELGHRRIAYLGPVGPSSASEMFVRRMDGYLEALAAADITPRASWLMISPEEVLTAMRGAEAPTAIFVINDRRAKPLVQALEGAGVRVPEDLAIVSFDNVLGSEMIAGGLTTVDNPVQLVGEVALRHMTRLLNGEDAEACRSVLPVKLIVRRSSGGVA
jgi:DNA-binding LacI/PurR family transcriptional regulator